MTWGQFFDLVVRYRQACRAFNARRYEREQQIRDELGRQIDELIAERLLWLAEFERRGEKFPELVTTSTFGGFRDIVAIHRYAWHAFDRDPSSQNRLQAREDTGWSIDELIRERQRRILSAKPAEPTASLFDAPAAQEAAS